MENSEIKLLSIFDIDSHSNLLQLSDATLHTDDGCTFNIHRIILVKSSEYFRAMFCRMGKNRNEFTIPGISGDTLSDILCYMYTGDICITKRNVTDLLIAANYLLFKDILLKIKQNIKDVLNIDSCLKLFIAAQQTGMDDIAEKCCSYICMHFEELLCSRSKDLADLPLESLSDIISNRNLRVHSETTIWKTIIQWTSRDIQSRKHHVPHLLTYLASKEIDEKLATDILQHEIFSKYVLTEDSKEKKCLRDFNSNQSALLSILRKFSVHSQELYSYRIPEKLYVMLVCSPPSSIFKKSEMYITYSNNKVLWRKVGEMECHPDFMIAVGEYLYLFEFMKRCRKFNMRTMLWEDMESLIYSSEVACIVAIDNYIYVFGEIFFTMNEWSMKVYDTVYNKWFDGVTLQNIRIGSAVTLGGKIYVVGTPDFEVMATYVFDTATQQWTGLKPPRILRGRFVLLAYHQKLFVMGGVNQGGHISSVEVFDPARNEWRAFPNLPYTYSYANAVVLEDKIFVYEKEYNDDNNKTVCWNDAEEIWEKLADTDPRGDLCLYKFCTIDDEETIKSITKQNRNPEVQFEDSIFNRMRYI